MPKDVKEFGIVISCPNDVLTEKTLVEECCQAFSHAYHTQGVSFKSIHWKSNVTPLITGTRTQQEITRQFNEQGCDVYIGIMWHRFGNKQENGFTPTEEEFHDALDMKEATGKPVVMFFFKKSKPRDGSYDTEQLDAVNEFRKRVEGLNKGLYETFTTKTDFQKKVFKHLLYVINNFERLTQVETGIVKFVYEEVEGYLSRAVMPLKDYTPLFSSYRKDLRANLVDVVEQEKLVALVGDPGVGKSTELRRVAFHFSQDISTLHPFLFRLNEYIGDSIDTHLPKEWDSLDDAFKLVILDGLDEIENKNRITAIRQIETFVENHPSAHVLISCRSNFYRSEAEGLPGTLKDFQSYALLDLSSEDIDTYTLQELNSRKDSLYEEVNDKRLWDFMRIPFFLTNLVQDFKEEAQLPTSKAEVFTRFLERRMGLDQAHFRTVIDLGSKEVSIRKILGDVAIAMETLGRNTISEEELMKLVPLESDRELLKHCTAWKKNEEPADTWQFEHNGIQEYLAAQILSKHPLETIKSFIAFGPEYKKVMPSWVNTLSFLLSLYEGSDLLDWILEIEPELAVCFEPEKVERNVRITIFKSIFNKYKEKKIWIDREKFSYSDLAHFGQTDETITFLIQEAENAEHFTTLANAIQLLGESEIYSNTEAVEKLLIRVVAEETYRHDIRCYALIALANLGLNTKENVSVVVDRLRLTENDWIRFGLYYFLYTSEFLNEKIDVFLEGIQYCGLNTISWGSARADGVRVGDERWHLKEGLIRVSSPEALKKILSYFEQNPSAFENVTFEECASRFANISAKLFADDKTLFENVLSLFVALRKVHLEEISQELLVFFTETKTRLQAFEQLFQSAQEFSDFATLATVADQSCIERFVQLYTEGEVSEDNVWWFQNTLYRSDEDLFTRFNMLINEASGDTFKLQPPRNYTQERETQKKKDIAILFDKDRFLSEIRLVYNTENKNTFSSEEFIDLLTEHYDNPYFSKLVVYALNKQAGDGQLTLSDAIDIFNKSDWDWFIISTLYHKHYFDDADVMLDDKQRVFIEKWCLENVSEVDFKTAITPKNDGGTANMQAIILWYCLRHFKLDFPKSTLLDMISFDWIEGHQMVGIEYLEEYLTKREITQRVLENLEHGIAVTDILKSHLDFCFKHRILEALPFAIHIVVNTEDKERIRSQALKIVVELSNQNELEQLLPRIVDELKWDVVDVLIKKESEFVHRFLPDILTTAESEQDRYCASLHLIYLGDMSGLAFYTNWIKQNKTFKSGNFNEKSPLLSLRDPKAIPYLLELLDQSYQEGFIQDDFDSLENVVLGGLKEIGIQSEDNFRAVQNAVSRFVEEKAAELSKVNFLNAFLEKLEQQFYVAKSEKLSIGEVISKVKKLHSDT